MKDLMGQINLLHKMFAAMPTEAIHFTVWMGKVASNFDIFD